MVQPLRPCPAPPRARHLTLGLLLLVGVTSRSLAEIPAPPSADRPPFATETGLATVADLVQLPDAARVEAWLYRFIPPGTTLDEASGFFGTSTEAFYETGEGLLVFVYRSEIPDQWVAWVSFDPLRGEVVHVSAIDL